MMAEFNELRSVYYNYEVGYLEGLRQAARLLTLGSVDALLQEIAEQENKIQEEE